MPRQLLPDSPLVNPATGRVEDKQWLALLRHLAALSVANLEGTITLDQLVEHATTHKTSGDDEIKLDELGTPTDNTNLNATTGRHGLLPKLSGNGSHALRGDGTWG